MGGERVLLYYIYQQPMGRHAASCIPSGCIRSSVQRTVIHRSLGLNHAPLQGFICWSSQPPNRGSRNVATIIPNLIPRCCTSRLDKPTYIPQCTVCAA